MWYVSFKDKVLIYITASGMVVYKNIYATRFTFLKRRLIWGRGDDKTAAFDEEGFLDFGVPYQSIGIVNLLIWRMLTVLNFLKISF